jgi:hypothetical protein
MFGGFECFLGREGSTLQSEKRLPQTTRPDFGSSNDFDARTNSRNNSTHNVRDKRVEKGLTRLDFVSLHGIENAVSKVMYCFTSTKAVGPSGISY